MAKADGRPVSVQDWRSLPLVDATPPRGLWSGTRYSISAVWSQRSLIRLLIQRELKSKYKDSFLGIFWSLARPLVQLLIYYVAIGKFLGAERAIPEFAIFVFAGLTAWGLFFEVAQGSTSSIVANAGLIKKVYLPREIFPLAVTGSALFNTAVQLVILIAATVVLGQAPLSWDLLYALAGITLILVFAFAVGLFLAAVTVYFRDIQHLVDILLLILFWASPIVYSYEFVHGFLQGNWIEQLYLSNPITIGVMSFQRGIWVAGETQLWPADMQLRIAIMMLVSLALLWISQRIFARLEGNFAQEI